jgi:hypothetical protein
MSSTLLALPNLVGHRIADAQNDPIDAALFEYLLAGNGLFVRARRREFAVSLPLLTEKISGLPNADVGIFWRERRIHADLWLEILSHARRKRSFVEFKEDVYLIYWDDACDAWRWTAAGRDSSRFSKVADDTLPH